MQLLLLQPQPDERITVWISDGWYIDIKTYRGTDDISAEVKVKVNLGYIIVRSKAYLKA